MEKMEVDNVIEEVVENQIEEHVNKEKGAKGTKWIIDKIKFVKTCDACGAVMRGWAFREPFQYCPICGAMAEKAE